MFDWIGSLAGEVVGILVSFVFQLFANLDISAATNAISGVLKFVRAACYFLPMGAIAGIFAVVIGLWNMRIVIRTIKIIWELIPVL